jgi:hypothetical protein
MSPSHFVTRKTDFFILLVSSPAASVTEKGDENNDRNGHA